MRHLPILLFVFLVACGDNANPAAAPGDELTGTWVLVSGTEPGLTETIEQTTTTTHYRADGTLHQTIVMQGLEASIEGTWSVVGGKLVTIWAAGGETYTISEAYTVRGDHLTLVNDEDQSVEIWERR